MASYRSISPPVFPYSNHAPRVPTAGSTTSISVAVSRSGRAVVGPLRSVTMMRYSSGRVTVGFQTGRVSLTSYIRVPISPAPNILPHSHSISTVLVVISR